MAGLQGSGKTTATRQARALPARGARLLGRRRRLRRLPPRRRRPARQGRRPGRRDRLRAGHRRATRSTSPRWALDQAKRDGKDVLIVDTSRPPARRPGADGRAGRHPQGDQAARRPARRRRDDRPGRRQRRRAVRRGRPVRRRRDVQARRRRPRRRRAVGQGGHRQADHVRLHGREAGRLRALPPRPHGPADPRHGRRPVVHREGRAARSTRTRRSELERKLRKNQFDARGLPRPAQAGSARWAR